MEVRELRPRLWYWTARHPDWTPDQGGDDGWEPDVGCYAYVPPDGDKRTQVTDTFAAGDSLPGGIEARGAWLEAVYWLPEHRGIVVDDSLIAAPAKPLRVWSGGDDTRTALRPLLELPIEMVLLTHGEPLLERGREALARALEA